MFLKNVQDPYGHHVSLGGGIQDMLRIYFANKRKYFAIVKCWLYSIKPSVMCFSSNTYKTAIKTRYAIDTKSDTGREMCKN